MNPTGSAAKRHWERARITSRLKSELDDSLISTSVTEPLGATCIHALTRPESPCCSAWRGKVGSIRVLGLKSLRIYGSGAGAGAAPGAGGRFPAARGPTAGDAPG